MHVIKCHNIPVMIMNYLGNRQMFTNAKNGLVTIITHIDKVLNRPFIYLHMLKVTY